jgi:signal transduction histidine kinase
MAWLVLPHRSMLGAFMASRPARSISAPIIWGSVSATLTVVMLVGWVYLFLKNGGLTEQWAGNFWLLVGGIISLVAITTVLILFSVFLARQILEIRRQTTFIDSVTHELRSPLASIRLGLQTLGRTGLANEQKEQLRAMMLEDTDRLAAFIDDILEATRLEYAHAGQMLNHVSLGELIHSCVDTVARRHTLDPSAIEIDVDDATEVRIDGTAVETVLKNLIDNAIKYSNPPVRVQITARASDQGRVEICVRDRGVGIPPAELRRIFNRFYRVDHEDVRARRGTGLGLFVVKALVKDLGGRLKAHSDGRGKGTTMTISLPYISKDGPAAANADHQAHA